MLMRPPKTNSNADPHVLVLVTILDHFVLLLFVSQCLLCLAHPLCVCVCVHQDQSLQFVTVFVISCFILLITLLPVFILFVSLIP